MCTTTLRETILVSTIFPIKCKFTAKPMAKPDAVTIDVRTKSLLSQTYDRVVESLLSRSCCRCCRSFFRFECSSGLLSLSESCFYHCFNSTNHVACLSRHGVSISWLHLHRGLYYVSPTLGTNMQVDFSPP